jgi:hypothetical protein
MKQRIQRWVMVTSGAGDSTGFAEQRRFIGRRFHGFNYAVFLLS